MKILPPNKIYLSKSEIHGWGVFANKEIKKDEVIEESPIYFPNITDKDECMKNYRFYWPKGTYDSVVLSWGWGNLYNHSYTPNAEWISNIQNQTFEFVAIKDIQVGEEILVNYGESYWS